jgi:S1-C subfamily serine protease
MESPTPDKDKTPSQQTVEPEVPTYSVSSSDGRVKRGTSSGGVQWRELRVRVPQLPSFKRPQLSGSRLRVGLAALVLLLAIGAGFLGGWLESRQQNGSTNFIGGTSLSNQKKVVTSESELISDIAKTVGPSVVSVDVKSQSAVPDFFGFSQPQSQEDAGTGIIISSDGLIITNRHVVPAGTTSVSVTLSDGTELPNVQVVGRTSDSDSLDIAFLKITDAKGHKLTPAVIGDSSKVQVGDSVVAIGNALGQFQNTVTAGIISGFGRQVQASDSTGASSENLDDLFQTDAAINEGNSGGPLVNLNGQVIGINTAIASNSQNVGFAIPINDVAGLIKQVESTGKLARPYLGVRYIPLTADVASQYGLSVNRGAYIAPAADPSQPSVVAGGPADNAGLKEGDIITQVNGTNIDETHSLTALLDQHNPGDKLDLTILRGSKTAHITVTLGTAPSS